MQTFLLSLFITVVVWLFNLEFNSSLGNVWLRPDHTGTTRFSYRSLITLLIEPFKNPFFWYPYNWDINFYTLLGIVYLISKCLEVINN